MSQPATHEEWIEHIKRDVSEHRVLVYAKGSKNAAMCGFSHRVMEVFNSLDVDYEVRDIFSDPLRGQPVIRLQHLHQLTVPLELAGRGDLQPLRHGLAGLVLEVGLHRGRHLFG